MQEESQYQISWRTVAIRSLRWHWRLHSATAVALAVAVATLAGAIIIGWSLQKSLASRLLTRLGGVNQALVLAMPAAPGLQQRIGGTAALEAAGVAVNETAGQGSAVPARIWAIDGANPGQWQLPDLAADEVVLNSALADDCGVHVGDWIALTVDVSSLRPELGLFTFRRPGELRQSLRLHVRAIIPAGGWGDFALTQSQSTPRNAFVRLDAIANAAPNRDLDMAMPLQVANVELADLGLRLRQAGEMKLLQSRAVAFTDQQLARLGAGQRTLAVHIAQAIRGKGGAVSYGVVASDSAARLKADEVVLNEEIARELGAELGDVLELSMILSRPDGTFGTQSLKLRVAQIDPISSGIFIPEVTTDIAGMTTADRLGDWKAPFPVEMSRVSAADERYWEQHRTTPKAIIADSAMQQLWRTSGFEGTRAVMSIVLDPSTTPERIVQEAVAADPQWTPVDLRKQALAAGQGSSDFAGLFVAMSIFMVIGAVAAAAGVARTAMESRLAELGLAEALGLDRQQWRRWLLMEQALIAVPAALAGIVLGVLYAAGMLRLFTNLGRDVWEMPPIVLDVRWPIVIVGLVVAAMVVTIAWWQSRRELRRPIRELLGSVQDTPEHKLRHPPGRWRIVAGLLAACAAIALARAGRFEAGLAYFVAAAAMLVACWGIFSRILGRRPAARPGRLALVLRTALAQPRRMALTFAIFAVATLVLCSVALYRTGESGAGADLVDRRGPSGGYALRLVLPGESRIDFSTAQGLERAGLNGSLPPTARLYGMAMSGGTEGGCLNLARPAEMQVLAVSHAIIARGGFPISGERAMGNPWRLIESDGATIPVFGDAETMQWIEHRQVGDEFEIPIDGRLTRVHLAGVIHGGLFSGQLLMSEANFRRLLPHSTGYRAYLIESSPADLPALRDLLKPLLQDGALLESTGHLIARVASVQRLYMTMFLVLGSLGLLLGGAGVLSVVARDAVQRRGELAVMQAAGLSGGRIAGLVSLGHLLPVFCGLAAGCLSACIGYLATGLPTQPLTALAIPAGLAVVVGIVVYLLARMVQPREPALALRSEG